VVATSVKVSDVSPSASHSSGQQGDKHRGWPGSVIAGFLWPWPSSSSSPPPHRPAGGIVV